jgi:hypothetical protein
VPGAGGLPEVVQPVGADTSRYISEFQATLPVLRQVNALQDEFLAKAAMVRDALGSFRGAPGVAAAADDIGKANAAIREGLAAARDYQSQMAAVQATAGDVAAAHAIVLARVAALAAATREGTAAQQAYSTASTAAAGQIRAQAGSVADLATSLGTQVRAEEAAAAAVRQTTGALREQAAALQARASAATVQVETRSVYGREAYYPANDTAKLFTEIAGLKQQIPAWVLQLAGKLGYSVEGASGITGGTGVRSSDVVQVQARTVYDKSLAYPANEAAEIFARLAGSKTLTESTMKLVGDLGYTVEDLGRAAAVSAVSLGEQGAAQEAVAAVVADRLTPSLGTLRDTARDTAAAVANAAAANAAAGGGFTGNPAPAAAAALIARNIIGSGRTTSNTGDPAVVAALSSMLGASAAGGGAGAGGGVWPSVIPWNPYSSGGLWHPTAGGGQGDSGGGGFFGSFLGGALGGLGGGGNASSAWRGTAAAIATWYPRIHWAMMLTNEVLATAGPAAIAALAGTAVGLEGGQTGFDRVFGVNAVGQSIGGSLGQTPGQFLGLGDALQTAQTKADPQVWELMGAAINSVRAGTDSATGGLSNFWQMGTNTIDMMDRFGAQVTLDFKQGLGNQLAGAVQGGTQDLEQFGDVLGNVGDTFLHVIPSLPGVGSDLLSTLQFATKGLSDAAEIGSKTGLLGPLLALEAGSRYGPAIVGAAASLVGRAGAGFTAAGAEGVGGFLGTAPRTAVAADIGKVYNPATGGLVTEEGEAIAGTGVAGALGGATALDVGLAAGAVYLGAKVATYKTPGQQSAAALQSQVGTDSFTQAIADIASGINQLSPTASQVPPAPKGGWANFIPNLVSGPESFGKEIGHDVKSGNIIGLLRDTVGGLILGPPPTNQQAAQAGISGLTQQYQELLGAGKQIASTFKVSVPEAFALADQAGLQLSTAMSGNGKLTAVALQQILNTQTGLQAMTGGFGSGVYNTAVNAVQIAKGLAGSQLSTVNSAYDQIVQNAAQGPTAATGFAGGMQALATLGLPAAQKAPSAKTVRDLQADLGISSTAAEQLADAGGTAKSVKAVADALTGFTSPASQAAWAAFSSTSTSAPGMIQAAETMMDQLRTAQASGVLTQGQVAGAGAYEARQLLPYARRSPAALAQMGILSQEMGGPGFVPGESQAKNYAAISGAIDKASVSAKGYTAIQNTMAVGMSDVSQQALSFSSVLSSDVANSMAAGATGAAGGNKAMQEFAGSLKGGASGFDATGLKGVVSQLKEAGESLSDVKVMVGDVGALKGVSAAGLAGIVKAATIDYEPKVVGQLRAPPAPDGGRIRYGFHVDPPVAPPPPHGGAVEYDSKVKMPVVPHIPDQSFNIIGHIFTVGGTGLATSTLVGGGGGMHLSAQHGGLVRGHGSGDIIPAMLEPGEAIVPRHLVGALAPFLGANKVPGFQSGGFAGDVTLGEFVQDLGDTEKTLLEAISSLSSSVGGISSQLSSSYGPAAGAGRFAPVTGTPATSASPAGTPASPVAVQVVSGGGADGGIPAGAMGAMPIPAAAMKVVDAFEKTFAGMGNPWGKFASQIMNGLLDGIKDAPKETAAMAKALIAKVTQEVDYAKQVSATAVSGLGLGSMAVATPTKTSMGTPYQYYADQAAVAAGGAPLSVQQQMGDYLQAIQSFQGDTSKLAKGKLDKGVMEQLLAAGPLQGDELAQSILGGKGGIGAVNKLWGQINKASNQLGISGAEDVYGYGGVGKTVPVKATADAAPVHALQAAINSLHGKTVTIEVSVTAASGGGGLTLTPAQIKSVTAQVQAKLLQQAKRTGRTGLQLPGYKV